MSFLLIVILLSILITHIATVAITHTGLSRDAARFQARSAFTGVGFTTMESEAEIRMTATALFKEENSLLKEDVS